MKNFSSHRFVALGDLVADFYYHNNKLSLVDGGSSKFNSIIGLSFLGNSTAVISGCSASMIGEMLITGLQKQQVDTQDVFRFFGKSRIYHLTCEYSGFKSSKTCPICGEKSWYSNSIATMTYCISKLQYSDIILFDNLKREDIDLIKNTQNEKVIDLGSAINSLKALSSKAIILTLCSRFEIIQITEKVEQYLNTRFNFTSSSQLYNFLHPKILIITRGKNGAEAIYNSRSYKRKPDTVIYDEFDTTGAGDAFFSIFLHEYYSSGKDFKKTLEKAFQLASTITPIVIGSAGARGHIYSAFTPTPKPGICTCEDFLSFK